MHFYKIMRVRGWLTSPPDPLSKYGEEETGAIKSPLRVWRGDLGVR
jgi:hypothetical protein